MSLHSGYNPGATAAGLALIRATDTAAQKQLLGITANYVSPTTMTVAELITNYPPAANVMGLYARVSDLYGSVDDIMRTPLVTAPTLRATGTLLGNLSFSMASTNAYIGQRQRIYMQGVLGIFAASITGLIGSNLTLLGNTYKDVEYGPTGWFGA